MMGKLRKAAKGTVNTLPSSVTRPDSPNKNAFAQLSSGLATTTKLNEAIQVNVVVDASAIEAAMGSINERLTGIEVTTRNERKVRAHQVGVRGESWPAIHSYVPAEA